MHYNYIYINIRIIAYAALGGCDGAGGDGGGAGTFLAGDDTFGGEGYFIFGGGGYFHGLSLG